MADKKRDRGDSGESVSYSPSPKKLPRVAEAGTGDAVSDRVDSANSWCEPVEFEWVSQARVVELLDIFDVPDPVKDHDVAIPELDSVVRSLQEEISAVPEFPPAGDTTRDPREPPSELGYLQEASDGELGLPPRFSPSNDKQEEIEVVDVEPTESAAGGFDGEIPLYESFELRTGGDSDVGGGRGGCPLDYDDDTDFVALDGLFDHGPENSKLPWQPEGKLAL